MRDSAYYQTKKPFAPQPGGIYMNECGDEYICLNYALYISRYNRAEVLPVMQRVNEDRDRNWTLFAHDIVMYEDGCIAWGFSSQIGFLPREPYHGDLEMVNRKLQSDTVWMVTESWSNHSVVDEELEIMGEDAFNIVGIYDSEEKAKAKQAECMTQNKMYEMEFGCDPVDVEIAKWEIE